MSVQALSWVLENAHARLGARLVLIALANHAHDDGSNAFISQQTIAREAHLTDRQVRRCLKELEASGEIARTDRKADGRIVWQVVLRPAEMSGGQIVHGHPRQSGRTNRAENVYEMSDKPLRTARTVRGRALARDTTAEIIDRLVIE